MASLSDKLKSLGVKVGAQNLPAPQLRHASPQLSEHTALLERVLAGHPLDTPLGETFVIESFYTTEYRQGRFGLQITASLQGIAEWAGERRVCECEPHAIAFLDTETTGLAGGTGTYAFLIGVGRFVGNSFHLAQFFMRDPIEEPAQLAALEQFLAPCQALVTFNGKAFDVPLLNTRYITHGWPPPLIGSAHVDLLHLARRLWRDRLPSRTLGNLEVQILGAARTQDDIPGWMIPGLYFDYLRDRDPLPMKKVMYHNAMDVISMAALFNHMAGLLADPFNGGIEHSLDTVALAKLFEAMGNLEMATRLYIHGLEQDLPRASLLEAILRLATIQKRQGDLQAAVNLWEQAARYQHLPAYLELAKFYEHHLRDYRQALDRTQSAIDLVRHSDDPPYIRRQWLADLEHRLARLQRKLAARPDPRSDSMPASDY